MQEKHRLLILGAGFSQAAGFPLADELWSEIRCRASHLTGRASKFQDDVRSYIDFRRDCDSVELTPETVDFEDFMKFLDLEHFLGLRGSDTWSDDGNEGSIVTKILIAEILAEHSVRLTKVPGLYLEFARRLQPNDLVFTFNYDTLLERALTEVKKPFRLFSSRYKVVNKSGGTCATDYNEVVVLKVHGSIDWFDRSHYEWLVEDRRTNFNLDPPYDSIFSNAALLDIVPITDGPCFDTDPLRAVYRAKNLSAIDWRRLMFRNTPRTLSPSAAKIMYASRIGDFWRGMRDGGVLNFGMAIIGFSLPPQDDYAKQILHALVTNYQQQYWGSEVFGKTKTPLVVVDFFSSKDAERNFKERYRFVDWSRTTLDGGGFSATSLEEIFK